MSGTYEVRLVGSYKNHVGVKLSEPGGMCSGGSRSFSPTSCLCFTHLHESDHSCPRVYVLPPESSGRHRLHGWRHHLDHLMLVTYKLDVDAVDNLVAVAVGVAFFVCYLSIRSGEHNVRALQLKKKNGGYGFRRYHKGKRCALLERLFPRAFGGRGRNNRSPVGNAKNLPMKKEQDQTKVSQQT